MKACFGSVVTAALGVVLYPAEHGLGHLGRMKVLLGSALVLGLVIMVLRRAAEEQRAAMTSGTHETPGKMKKMALIWYAFGALLASSLLRIPLLAWYRHAAPWSVIDTIGVVVGVALLLFVIANAVLLLRCTATTVAPPLKADENGSND
jgi:hypothetical protein